MKQPFTWTMRIRAGQPRITPRMMKILQHLRAAKERDWPFVALEGVHGRTIKSLERRGWIFASPGLDGTRYTITTRGLKALKLYEPRVRRYDNICPNCGIRPKHISATGRKTGYCIECNRQSGRWKYRMNRPRFNTLICPKCGIRPRHRFANGRYVTYCAECRRENRKAEKQRRQARLRQQIAEGNHPLCYTCKTEPVMVDERRVHDRCRRCYLEYMTEYNHKRRNIGRHCCVPGCDKPVAGPRSERCVEHRWKKKVQS